jgi:hypothetical protein
MPINGATHSLHARHTPSPTHVGRMSENHLPTSQSISCVLIVNVCFSVLATLRLFICMCPLHVCYARRLLSPSGSRFIWYTVEFPCPCRCIHIHHEHNLEGPGFLTSVLHTPQGQPLHGVVIYPRTSMCTYICIYFGTRVISLARYNVLHS